MMSEVTKRRLTQPFLKSQGYKSLSPTAVPKQGQARSVPVGLRDESKVWKIDHDFWHWEHRSCSTCRSAAAESGSRQGAGSWQLCPMKNQSRLRLSPTAAPRGNGEWQQRSTASCVGWTFPSGDLTGSLAA